MDAVFLKVFNMSVAAGWLVLVVVLLRFALKKAPKALRCVLWGMVGLRLVLPFSIESVLSLIPSAETLPPDMVNATTPAINSGISAVDIALNPVLRATLSPDMGDSVNPMQVVALVAAVIWLVGITAMLLYSMVSYLRLRHRVSASMPVKDNLWLCDHIPSPFILGIIKPRIYLPSNIEEQTMDYVVAHENAHLKRRDHWWKPLGFALLALHWFNPLMWVAYVLLCRDIELACDERVIKQMDTDRKIAYSEALLSCSVPRRMLVACPLAFGEVAVNDRIKAALHYKKPAFWLVMVAVVVAIAVAVGFLTNPPTPNTAVHTDLEGFLSEVILTENRSEHTGDNFVCEAHRVMEIETDGENTIVYVWVLYQEYGACIHENPAGSYIPTVITARQGEDDVYSLVEYWTPGDGTNYGPDIQAKFPEHLWSKALDVGLYSDELQAECTRMAQAHFGEDTENVNESFDATVLRYTGSMLVVEPDEGEWERNSAGEIEVSTNVISAHPVPQLEAGDKVRIVYNGEIQETYPAQITTPYAILLAEDSSVSDVGGVDGPQNVKVSTERTYICVDSPDYGNPYLHPPTLRLKESDHTFEFTISSLSSYHPTGTYKEEGSTLVLTSEDGLSHYTFKIDGPSLEFDAANSTLIPTYQYSPDSEPERPIPDGGRFIRQDE